jgi:hypothetical protein
LARRALVVALLVWVPGVLSAPPALAATTARLVAVDSSNPQGWSEVDAVRVAGDGSVIVAGRFNATLTLGTGGAAVTLQPRIASLFDAYLAWYEPDGTLRWAQSFGSDGTNDTAVSLDVDAANNVFVTGSMPKDASFGTAPNTISIAVSGFGDAYLAKYTAAGAIAWVKKVGAGGTERGFGVAVDPTNSSVWMVGSYTSATMPFGFGTAARWGSDPNMEDGFAIKYRNDGTYNVGRLIRGPGHDAVTAVDVRPTNGVVLGGYAEELGEILPFPNSGSTDGFVASMSFAGDLQWFSGVHGTGADSVTAVGVHPNGAIVFAGKAGGTVNGGPATLGTSDVVVGNVGYFGGTPVIKLAGGYGSDQATSLSVGTNGDVWVAGFVQPPANIAGVPVGTGGGANDGFVFRYVQGYNTIDKVTPIATGAGNGKPMGIGATSTSYAVVGNYYSATATAFGKTGSASVPATQNWDGFIYVP